MENSSDRRHISRGLEIPTENYSDQPYIVKTDDGARLCVVTTGPGREGEAGQHVVSMRSADQGKTWSAPADVEPADGPEASYAVLLKAPLFSWSLLHTFLDSAHSTRRAGKISTTPAAVVLYAMN